MSAVWKIVVDRAAMHRVLNAETDNFVELARIADLDPARDFTHLDLSQADLRNCDLTGFDFRGCIVPGAKFRGAKIAGAIFDGRSRKLPELVGAADYGKFHGPIRPAIIRLTPSNLHETLFHASLMGDTETIRQCIAGGVDLDGQRRAGSRGASRSVLQRICYAVPDQRPAVVAAKFLLRAGADPNRTDSDGLAPLHGAVENQVRPLARLLLEFGADPNFRDRSDRTPLGIATSRSNWPMIALLEEHGASTL
jgi:hypothetical protein